MEMNDRLLETYEPTETDSDTYSSYPRSASTSQRRESGSNTIKYITLATALVAVCIGTAALIVSVKDSDKNDATNVNVEEVGTQADADHRKSVATSLVTSHPMCSRSMPNYYACLAMSTKISHVIDYASQNGVTDSDVAAAVNNNTFGASPYASVVLHSDGTVMAADSTLASHIGKSQTFLANPGNCQFSAQSVCFSCMPMSNNKQCLPVAHFQLPTKMTTSTRTAVNHAKVQSQNSYTAFHTSGSTGAVVGSPTTDGASYQAHGQITAGNAGYSASATNSGGGNLAASESAHATALSATGDVSGQAHANLGHGVGVTANGNLDGHANAGISESAHANTNVGNGQASFSAAAGASARADVGVSGSANANLDTPLGNVNLGTVAGGASADAHAGASANAHGSLGASGVSAHFNANAGAGVSANAHGSFSLLGGAIHNSAHVGVSAGPEASVGGGFHATDHNGDISIGASGAVAAGLGLNGGDNININTHQIGSDIVNGIQDGVHDVENFVTGNSNSNSASGNSASASASNSAAGSADATASDDAGASAGANAGATASDDAGATASDDAGASAGASASDDAGATASDDAGASAGASASDDAGSDGGSDDGGSDGGSDDGGGGSDDGGGGGDDGY